MSDNYDGPALADALLRSQHRERELRADRDRLRAALWQIAATTSNRGWRQCVDIAHEALGAQGDGNG